MSNEKFGAEYKAEYRRRKASGNFVDRRMKTKPKDPCLNCGTELIRHRENRPRKFCSNNKCQHEYSRKVAIENGIAGTGSTKRHLVETRGYKCECCGIAEWQNKPLVLELDHINGNFNDNSLDNVRLLCPNCHSQTETFKSKNTGQGRLRNKQEPKPFYLRLSDQHSQLDTGQVP